MTYARRCLLDLLGPAGDTDGLIRQVEDDRAHAEAARIRAYVFNSPAHRPKGHQAMLEVADLIDPYELRGVQLVRKSDGKQVML